ncbi:hypothetical protein V8E53_004481 [Lactarius tabidus]
MTLQAFLVLWAPIQVVALFQRLVIQTMSNSTNNLTAMKTVNGAMWTLMPLTVYMVQICMRLQKRQTSPILGRMGLLSLSGFPQDWLGHQFRMRDSSCRVSHRMDSARITFGPRFRRSAIGISLNGQRIGVQAQQL